MPSEPTLDPRTHGLLDALPIPAWRAGSDMRRFVLNKAWGARVGREPGELTGNEWATDIHPEDFKGTLDAYFEAVAAREPFALRYRLRRPDGSYGWVVDEGAPVVEGQAYVGFVGVCRDDPSRGAEAPTALETYVARRTAELAEANERLLDEVATRKQAEERLRQSEELFSKAFHAAPFGACLVRLADRRVLDVNASYARLTGFKREAFFDARAALDHGLSASRLLALRRAVEGGGRFGPVELRLRQASGDTRFVLVSAEHVTIADAPCALIMALDVTERKRLEQDVLLAGEEERRKIAQDLHDDLGQQLTGLAFLSSVLGTALEREGSAHRETAEQVEALTQAALEHVRRLARALAPLHIQPDELAEALHRLADNTQVAFGIRCDVHASAPIDVPDEEAATHLYRIVQEAIANAIRHGHASTVAVELSRDDAADYLRVRNDGLPPPPEAASSGGLGLNSMRHRCESLGGEFSLHRLPEGGAAVTCVLPRR